MKKKMPSFYTINWSFNHDDLAYYDVMPRLMDCWNREKEYVQKLRRNIKRRKNFVPEDLDKVKMPETFNEVKKFILDESRYMFWAKCEYEVIVTGWPQRKNEVKIDIYEQIEKNIDVVTKLFTEYVDSKR